MNLVVTTFGSDGDVNPVLAIAAALVRRGVAVTFVANPFYAARVERTGSRFVPAGAYFDVFAALAASSRYLDAGRGALAVWRELAAPSIREIYPVVRDTVGAVGARAVVSHLASPGGAWAAAANGVPSILVTTSTAAWMSRHRPLVFANWRAPRRVQAALTVALRGIGGAVMRRALRGLAAELGAPPVADPVRAADLNIGTWPEWYRAPAADDPPNARMSGFIFDDAVGGAPTASADVASFLAAGAPPVVVGFGSAARLHATDRYRAVARACARLGRRCLLVGPAGDVGGAGAELLAVESAPYAAVFPAASAIVHHGGFGTCAEALRAGRPSLVTPFAFDQFDTAARIEDAGCGRWLRGDPTDEAVVAAHLDAVLRSAPLAAAARAAAERLGARREGAERAAELTVALVQARPSRRAVRGS